MQQRTYREIRWPFNGLHVGRSYHGQASDTTVDCQNVRNYDPVTGRSRGAQRAGLSRYLSAQASGSGNKQIQDITAIVTVPLTAGTATDLSARQMECVSVCNGTVQTFTDTAFTAVTGGTGALLSSAPVIFSAQLFGNLFYADGTNSKYYNGSSVQVWTAADGTLPVNGAHKPRLIESWRTRIVLSGLRGDDQNWFMSKAGDAFDFDYSPVAPSPIDAVAGNNSDAGYVGDIINTMIPYDDDTLLFGCDHSIWQMSGDPVEGGRIDEITDITGMAFGRPWCKAYDGSIFFMGSRGGIYRMGTGSKPQRISSDRIEESLAVVDLNAMIVRCVYDDRTQGIHFFITPLDGTTAATHYFYDLRRDAFFADKFAAAAHNPVSVYVLDGDDPDDRVVLLGGFDRRIRKIDYEAKSDDGYAIDSYVWLGPIRVDEQRKIHLNELIGTLSEESDNAYYDVYGAQGSQAAHERGQVYHSGTWNAGRNWPDTRRAGGSAIYLKVGNDELGESWSCETIMAAVEGVGITASRAAE